MNNKEWKRWLFWFTFAVASIVVYKTIDSVSTIFSSIGSFFDLIMPFVIAALISYILYIPCTKVEKTILSSKINIVKKHARGISTLIVYILAGTIIFILVKFIVPSVSTSVTDLSKNIPNYLNSAINFFENVDKDSIFKKLNVADYIRALRDMDINAMVTKWINIENITQSLKGIVGVASVIFNLFVTIVVSFYILLERKDIKNFLQRLFEVIFDKKTNNTIVDYYHKTNGIFFNYITSQLLDAFVIGIITSIAMSIMHIKYAVLLGFLIGMFNIIPYFGAIVAIVISILITIFTGGPIQALWLAIVVILLQQIDANIINPRILGASLNLSPILVIFSVTIGGHYFGVLGMFLGVPLVALLKLVINDFIELQKQKIANKDYLEKL